MCLLISFSELFTGLLLDCSPVLCCSRSSISPQGSLKFHLIHLSDHPSIHPSVRTLQVKSDSIYAAHFIPQQLNDLSAIPLCLPSLHPPINLSIYLLRCLVFGLGLYLCNVSATLCELTLSTLLIQQ